MNENNIDEKKLEEINLKRKKIRKEVFEWAQAILVALVIAYIIKAFIFERAVVDGNSMNDTLKNNQQLIVYKLGYLFHTPKRDDIVVIEYNPGKFNRYLPIKDSQEVDYVKRVIGLPGETVNIKDKHVIITKKESDGKQSSITLKEPYIKGSTYIESVSFPLVIPKNKILVMGDNREDSFDGRQFGLIDISRVRGKAILRIYPFKDFGNIYGNVK